MSRIIVGLIGIPLGFFMIRYNMKVKDMIGDIVFAERYLGRGGTYTFIKLFALFVSVASFLYMTGTLQDVLGSFLSPIM